jgi:amino acid adenylation domain-containing protein
MQNKTVSGRLIVAAGQKTKEREYWLKKLSGELITSVFPYDYRFGKKEERENREDTPRETVTFVFPERQSAGLLKLCKGSDMKLHIVLTAALAALLEKYTPNNHNDIIIGSPIFKQEKEGEYINTVLPLRLQVNTGNSFKDFILQTRRTIVEAVEHQSYPIEVLADELELEFTARHFSLFDTALVLRNIQDEKDIRHIPVNLLFSFNREGETIDCTVTYNSSLYEKASVERITAHLARLVEQAITGMDAPLSQLDILSDEEKTRLLEVFNDTRRQYPGAPTIHRWFEEQVEKTPERTAVVSPGTPPDSVTYRELNERANQLARELQEKGVKTGSVVGVILEPSVDLIVSILAVLKAGGGYLPIDHEYPEERVISILNESDADVLLTRSGTLQKYSYTALLGLKHARVEPRMTEARGQCDFDIIPHPDRSLINFEEYSLYIGHAMVKHAVSIQATRGCPYMCAFCHRTMEKKNVRRSAENIFEEVKYYYDRGVRRFGFVDEIFNLDAENSMRFYRLILKNKMKVQLFFPNGLRADRLTKEYIDLMVEAGTVNLGLALETASPRLQKLIKKNLDIEKLRENAEYFCSKYPDVILELFTMHGFPTETEEEAMKTLGFIKSLKWAHFPYVFLLKIHPSTDMMQLALDNGISREAIERSMTANFHEVPETLPFSKSFTRRYVAQFMNEYFLNKDRLLHVLPIQMKVATEKDLVGKYDNYLPAKISSFDDILHTAGLKREDLGDTKLIKDDSPYVPDYQALRKSKFEIRKPGTDAFRVLLLDLSVLFSTNEKEILQTIVTEPMGLLYLMTYLRETFKDRIDGRMYKSRIDFDSFEQLKPLVCDFKPHLIGIRTLSFFNDFLHRTTALIKEWGIDAPIITGGPYGTSDYKLVLQDPNIALTVLKEGEVTLGDIVEKMMANDYRLPGEEVLETIKGIAFIKEKDKARLKELNRELLCVDKLQGILDRHPVDNLPAAAGPQDLLYLISTSGSTGKPKSVMLEHRNMTNLMQFQYGETGIDFNKVLQFASIGFDVSAQEIFSTLLAGGELYLVTTDMKGDVLQLLDYIRQNRIEVVFLPPAFARFIFSDPQYIAAFPSCVRHIITAGEQLIVNEPFRKYIKEQRVVLHNHYGPTETHVVTTLTMSPEDPIEDEPSIGFPVSNTRIHILDRDLNLKPVGAVGELYISGANVGRGYLNSETLTHAKFMDDPFNPGERMYKTGDLARRLPDGSIRFIGRVDYQVKIRGYRIEPGEIERALMEVKGVKEAVVIDRKDAKGDKFLCAYIVPHEELDVSDLRDILSLSMPDYMIPSYFVLIDGIPLTPNGKTDKRALPEPGVQTGIKYTAPKDDIETRLAELWADVLSLEQDIISTDANFFELGGHSLKATILISRIQKTFAAKITLGEMFEAPTIQGLARHIKDAAKELQTSIEPAEPREYYPLSSAQKRMYIVYQLEKESIGYNMPAAMVVEGNLDPGRFEEAFRQVMQRQDSLRTQFVVIAGEPVQQIVPMEDLDFNIEVEDRRGNSSETMENADQLIRDFVRPFDLGRASLLRVRIVRTSDTQYLLMVDLHHIIGDGISTAILIREFMQFYNGEVLPPLRIQYRDYAVRQQGLMASGELKRQETYWLEQFDTPIPALDLPLDFPRPAMKSSEGRWVDFFVSTANTAKLKELARQNDATLYMVLLAVYNILLFKYSGRDTIVVGSAVAGRTHPDLENIIGVFLNTAAMKNTLSGSVGFIEFLRQVRENTLHAFENQDFQFEDLVEALGLKRDYSRNPVFDTMLNVQNMDIPEIKLGDLKLTPHKMENTAVKFDLKINVLEYEDMLRCTLDYSTKLFKPETMDAFIENFLKVIDIVAEDPTVKISGIHLVSESVKKELVEDFSEELEYEF